MSAKHESDAKAQVTAATKTSQPGQPNGTKTSHPRQAAVQQQHAVPSPPSTRETASLLSPSDDKAVELDENSLSDLPPASSVWNTSEPVGAQSWFAKPVIRPLVTPQLYQLGGNPVLDRLGWEFYEGYKTLQDLCQAAEDANVESIIVLDGRMGPIRSEDPQHELIAELVENVSRVRDDWEALVLHAPDPTLHNELIGMPSDFAGKYERDFYPNPPRAYWLRGAAIQLGAKQVTNSSCLELFDSLQEQNAAVYMLHPCFEEKAKKSKKKKKEEELGAFPSMGTAEDQFVITTDI